MKITTPLNKIAYQEWGSPDNPPLLALHGWLDNSASFENIAPYITKLGYRLVGMDFPGHGHSGWRPPNTVYSFIDFLADIAAFADEMGWEKFSIIGHSMGGGLASLFAGTFPDRVDKLILIEALGPITREADEAPKYLSQAIRRFIEHSKQPKRTTFKDIEQLVRLRLRTGVLKFESAKILMERGTEVCSEGEGICLRRDPRLNLPSFLRLTESQVLEFLKRIACPTALIWGENGYTWEKEFMDARSLSVHNLTQIIVPGHHHLHMDEPEPVALEIGKWLKSLE
jgi:pimeloyl-ACP methyl ester carboxylesterase